MRKIETEAFLVVVKRSILTPSLILDLVHVRVCVCVCECVCVSVNVYMIVSVFERVFEMCVRACVACVCVYACLTGCFLLCLCVHGDAKTKKDDTNTFTFTVAKFLGQA